jgi:hypothetical protein
MAIIGKFGKIEPSVDSTKEIRQSICTIAESLGDCVYLLGTEDGKDIVRKADPAMDEKVPVVGIVISKESDTSCRVQWLGESPSLYSGLDIGKVYFLDEDGKIVLIPGRPVAGYYWVQAVGKATTSSRIYISPSLNRTKIFA